MKISERNHPVLSLLKNNSIEDLSYSVQDKDFFENDMFFYDFAKRWSTYQPKFSKTVNVISESFYDATTNAAKKLFYIAKEIIKNETLEINETFINGAFTAMISCKLVEIENVIENEFTFFVFDTKTSAPVLYASKDKGIPDLAWVSKEAQSALNISFDEIQKLPVRMFRDFLYIALFKQYAEVETKFIASGKRVKDINTKYVNDSRIDLTFLNSKWFTNLVKSDAFKVRGHFRLQPYKNEKGQLFKKIIWIEDFMKEGYTSPAKITQ